MGRLRCAGEHLRKLLLSQRFGAAQDSGGAASTHDRRQAGQGANDAESHSRDLSQERERRTGEELRWTLPAYARYRAEVDPAAFADVVVRLDDPRRPALVLDRS